MRRWIACGGVRIVDPRLNHGYMRSRNESEHRRMSSRWNRRNVMLSSCEWRLIISMEMQYDCVHRVVRAHSDSFDNYMFVLDISPVCCYNLYAQQFKRKEQTTTVGDITPPHTSQQRIVYVPRVWLHTRFVIVSCHEQTDISYQFKQKIIKYFLFIFWLMNPAAGSFMITEKTTYFPQQLTQHNRSKWVREEETE